MRFVKLSSLLVSFCCKEVDFSSVEAGVVSEDLVITGGVKGTESGGPGGGGGPVGAGGAGGGRGGVVGLSVGTGFDVVFDALNIEVTLDAIEANIPPPGNPLDFLFFLDVM